MKTNISNHPAFSRLLAALFLLALYGSPAAGQDNTDSCKWTGDIAKKIENKGGNNGLSWESPFLITSAGELAYLAKQVNAGDSLVVGKDKIKINNTSNKLGIYYFALTDDIDLSSNYWTPIGKSGGPFYDHFDGQGHCINNMKVKIVSAEEPAYAGLFGFGIKANIRNLGVKLAEEGIKAIHTSKNTVFAGGIAGFADSISNCYVVGNDNTKTPLVEAKSNGNNYSYAGGIAGYIEHSLTHCYATVDVKALGTSKNYAGGIAGIAKNNTNNLYCCPIKLL